MDAAAFSDLPIVVGVGRGPAVVGATFEELQRGLGEPTTVQRYDDMYYPEWHALGVQAWVRKRDDRAIAISLLNGDPDSPKFDRVDGRTDGGVGFGATEDAIVATFGDPRMQHRGTDRKVHWARLVYDGITFRLVGNRLVSITIEKKKTPVASANRNAELEAAIYANPDDDAAYLVYADWLQQRGEPLGEFIVGHHRNGKLFLDEHQTDMLGPLADYSDMLTGLAWKNGFITTATVANTFERSPDHDGELEEFDVEELLGMLLDSEAGRFIQNLTVGIVTFQDNGYGGCMMEIGARRLLALRTLYIGDFHSEETELNWSHLGDASPLYAGIPNVQSLTLRSGTMSLGAIDLPEVRRFATLTGGLQKDAIASITKAKWPKLERLELQIGSSRYDSDIDPDDLRPIFDGEGLPPTLTHLGLANYEYTNEILPLLAASKILPRLRSLDLSLGPCGGDEGVERLLALKDAFAHLERLDLSESWLDPDGTRLVKAALPNANVDAQRYDARWADDRYIAAGE